MSDEKKESPQCTLNDDELVQKAFKWVQSLCVTGARSWRLKVPVSMDEDPDMIFIEVGKRLLEKNKKIEELEQEINKYKTA